MADWKFSNERTRVVLSAPPTNPLRLTATRLGAVLKLNPYSSDFQAWCEISRVWKSEFVENKYTKAGNAIEPIIIDWLKEEFGTSVVSPKDYYGNTFDEVRYNFYKNDSKVFGGMWDAKIITPKRETVAVVEIKTSSRPQDWVDGVPLEKLVQALQYGHLEHATTTYVAVAFLSDEDYSHPERFVVKEGVNFKLIPFNTETTLIPFDGELCTIGELMEYAEQWWEAYVLTGISPEFSEDKDKDILKELRTQRPDETDDSLASLMKMVEDTEIEINRLILENGIDILQEKCKNGREAIKRELIKLLDDDSDKLQIGSWSLNKTTRTSIDSKALKADNLLDKYQKTSVTYTLKKTTEKEDVE